MDLKPLFEPRTMAVFGVSSSNYRHPANEIFNKNLLRYPVCVYGVNPRGGTINSQPIHRSISEVPEPIDLAVIAVRADLVPEVMSECIKAKVRSAVVISGGFTEVGRRDLQERIVAIAKEAAFPFVGPNCLGIYVPSHVDTFFLPGERMVNPVVGNVSFVSQSGGILVDQMIKFTNEGVGLAKAISIGNKALLGELDLLDYLAADPATKVIAFYIEGFGGNEGREFVLKAEKCGKPVVVLKSGKSPGGSKAVSSHTASLAGDYASFSAVLSQYGIVEAANELELVSFCESLEHLCQTHRGQGRDRHGQRRARRDRRRCLRRPRDFGSGTAGKHPGRRSAKPSARAFRRSPRSPIPSISPEAGSTRISSPPPGASLPWRSIDCVLALLLPYIPGITSDLGAKLSSVARQCGKPLIAYVPNVEKYAMLIEGFKLNGVPVAHSIEGAVLMVDALRRNRP